MFGFWLPGSPILLPARARAALMTLLALLAFMGFAGTVSAAAKYAAIVVDAESGRVLYSRNADQLRYPASLTKIMTLYITFAELRAGRLALEDRVRFSERAASQPASKLGLAAGKSITVEQAILALVTKSANDVATALAERIARTEAAFARRMTQTARRLGMNRTFFRNASGLPDIRQKSTARDMSRLARAMLRHFPEDYRYFSRKSFHFKGERYKNHNKLLANYQGTDGIKTGYIRVSGFNLVASAERKGRRLIGVVYGGRTAARRDRRMRRLLDRGFDRAARILPPPSNRHPPRPGSKPVPRIASKSKPRALAAAPVGTGGWVVQVGAYREFALARRQALLAGQAVGDVLRRFGYAVSPVVDGAKPLYRARLIGLKREQAERACRVLKRRRMDCLALPPSRIRTSARRSVS